MARPQSPELRRSGTVPAFEPDNIASRLEAHDRPTSSGGSGPVPEESSPGHHPDHDQDKPDLDAFAARFSGADLDDLPTDTGLADDGAANGTSVDGRPRTTTRRAAPIAGAIVLVAVVVFLVRRRRS